MSNIYFTFISSVNKNIYSLSKLWKTPIEARTNTIHKQRDALYGLFIALLRLCNCTPYHTRITLKLIFDLFLFKHYTMKNKLIFSFLFCLLAIPGFATSISGSLHVCVGSTITLSGSPGSGTWNSGTPGVATVTGSGTTTTVTGVSAGTTTIVYTSSGTASVVVTVDDLPVITSATGIFYVYYAFTTPQCTITLNATPSGGSWVTSAPSQAAIGSSTGVVTPQGTPGLTTMTYTAPTGCKAQQVVTVSTLGSILPTTSTMCVGSTTAFTDLVGGVWTATNTHITIGSSSGIAVAASPGAVTINYAFPTMGGCYTAKNITVTAALPGITGSLTVCSGSTTTLSDATGGGFWTSSNPSVGSVGSATGVVTGLSGGTVTITYNYGAAGCNTTATVTVNPTPAPISGTLTLCAGSTASLSDAATGGTWTSSTPAVGTVGTSSGIVTGLTVGTSVITYVVGCGTVTATVTVNAAVLGITGTPVVCTGSTTALTDAATGGTWTSSTPTVGTVDGSGIVTGISSGTTTITYSTSSTCWATVVVTVIAAPGPVMIVIGGPILCSPGTIVLSDATPGGSWIVDNTYLNFAGTISAGQIEKIASNGTTTITYSIGSGCDATLTVTLDPTPLTIFGTESVCVGSVTTLTDAIGGGTWMDDGLGFGSVDATGDVTGLSAGTVVISYGITSGCSYFVTVTVNPLPTVAPISGSSTVGTSGGTMTLSDATTGGVWSSSTPSVATIDAFGTVTGVAASTATTTISYTVTDAVTGCEGISTLLVTACPGCRIMHPATGVNETSDTKGSLSLIPNPNSGSFTLSGNLNIAGAKDVVIEVNDVVGRTIYRSSSNLQGGLLHAEIILANEICKGVYLLRVHNETENHTFHFVIDK